MKKLFATTLAATLFVSLLAACDQTPAGDTADGGTSSEGKAITVMMNGTEADPTTQVYKDLTTDFNETNEYGATATLEMYENEQYKTKLATLMASNTVPDVFFTWELDFLRPYVDGGKVLDITEYVNADTAWKDTFIGGAFEPLTYDGGIYAVPTNSVFLMFYYNKEIFAANNLTVPTTYDEFLTVCDTLKAAGETPLTIACPDAWIPAQIVQQLTNGLGGMDVYNGLLDGSVAWNNQTHIEAGLEAQALIDAGYLQDGFLGMSSEESTKLFKDGKAAMYPQGSWDIATVTAEDSTITDNVGAFLLPAVETANDGVVVGSIDVSLGIASTSEAPDAAFDYIQMYTSSKYQEIFLYDVGRLPITTLEIDESKLSPLAQEAVSLSETITGLTPWLDRAFGAGEGVEFNNKVQAIFGGEDPTAQFDALQQFSEDNADR